MKVLQVYRTYFPDTHGGLEQAINQICHGTTRYGVTHRVFTLSKQCRPREVQRPEARVFRYPLSFEIASCGFSLGGFFQFSEHVRWADLIHYHFPWPFADLLHFGHRITIPCLVTYHSDVVRQAGLLKLYRPMERAFLSRMGAVVATSPQYLASSPVLSALGNVRMIPLSLDRGTYPSVSVECTERWRSEVGEGFFVFVGVLRYYKGLHILLEAMKGFPGRLVIIGEGPKERELKAQAARLRLDNVYFTGFVSEEDKVALLRLSRALVFPSHLRSEAFGVSLLEGAMLGKPLISAEIGTGTSFVNVDGVTGLVVAPEEPKALRRALDTLQQNDQLCLDLGQAARERFDLMFNSAAVGQQYNQLYQEVVAAYRSRTS